MPVSRTEKCKRSAAFRRALHRHGDLAAVGELDGISDQIDQDLPQPSRIAPHQGGHAGLPTSEARLRPLVSAETLRPFKMSRTASRKSNDRWISKLQLAGFDLGDVENIVDDGEQRLRRAAAPGSDIRAVRGRARVSSRTSVSPMMPFMGVRISWLMLARNSLLARLADSAASLACSSSASACLRGVMSMPCADDVAKSCPAGRAAARRSCRTIHVALAPDERPGFEANHLAGRRAGHHFPQQILLLRALTPSRRSPRSGLPSDILEIDAGSFHGAAIALDQFAVQV